MTRSRVAVRIRASPYASLRPPIPASRGSTPHDLRYTAVSLAVQAGAHVKAVHRMLGHASAAMTLDVHADLCDDDLDAVAKALDEATTASTVVKVLPRT